MYAYIRICTRVHMYEIVINDVRVIALLDGVVLMDAL